MKQKQQSQTSEHDSEVIDYSEGEGEGDSDYEDYGDDVNQILEGFETLLGSGKKSRKKKAKKPKKPKQVKPHNKLFGSLKEDEVLKDTEEVKYTNEIEDQLEFDTIPKNKEKDKNKFNNFLHKSKQSKDEITEYIRPNIWKKFSK